MSLQSFGRRELNPRIEKPIQFKPSKEPLAKNPVVARIRKTQFGTSTDQPTGVNVKQVASNGAKLLAKAPRVNIKKL